ncbi:LysR family transcriptional regulator [Gluconobacter roseus]|uniref:LysR family transcriptional regulator n=1 Tax=Gluconobacter roseus NBRC 3990 TaxID=1307950 RepID=A0A4Y3MCS9_9PROT|nr:LysR family transcriptional regulator [Gluconobacter roseus]GBR43485.1 transcriptional regulator [Gluconobacter roseus NBRC 3990]GEB05081.1 LysR family transcriptional regulator [Gluconobacter roseus NBRC 3990]GLP94430.1 LysR family transcriptional regulator [Gluconobacter roseus NBRC 3990]
MIAELRTFVVAAQTESFAAAARTVGLTQSAISAQIRRLEDELGYDLFERTGRSVTLTAAGRSILCQVEDILSSFEALRGVGRIRSGNALLRIGAISTAQTSLLAPAIARLHLEFPDLKVRIVPGLSMGLLDRLDAGELDAALIVRPPFGLMPYMEWHPIVKQDYVMVIPAHIENEDWREILKTQPFIRYDSRSFGGRTLDRFLKAQGISPHQVIETEELHTILQMVANNMGCSIVPYIFAVSVVPNIRVLPLGEQRIVREVGVMTLRGRMAEGREALIRYLGEASRDNEPPELHSGFGTPQENGGIAGSAHFEHGSKRR